MISFLSLSIWLSFLYSYYFRAAKSKALLLRSCFICLVSRVSFAPTTIKTFLYSAGLYPSFYASLASSLLTPVFIVAGLPSSLLLSFFWFWYVFVSYLSFTSTSSHFHSFISFALATTSGFAYFSSSYLENELINSLIWVILNFMGLGSGLGGGGGGC